MSIPLERFTALLADLLPRSTAEQDAALALYLQLVSGYSKVVNLTGFSDAPELVNELVLESLRLLTLGPVPPGIQVADLGSGNGSPVIPLAIMCPEADFVAIESRERRATFLELAQTTLKLDNLSIHADRAEVLLRDQPGQFELVTSRGFAPPGELLEIAAKLLAPGGEVRGYLGAAPDDLTEAASALGATVMDLLEYQGQNSPRHVYRLQF